MSLATALAELPVAAALPALRQALATGGTALLSAPPGSGKTTLVPLVLLGEPWLEGRTVLVLEPRRLAARRAAERMAELLGESPGRTVGYVTRFDRRLGPDTRVQVVTEGVLTRRLLADATLEGVGLVVFDEIHERSLEADLALVLCREVREALRPELRLLAMSATLGGSEIGEALGGAPLIEARGRQYPVEVVWLAGEPSLPLETRVGDAVRRALAETPGDVLVFLPGMREIRGAEQALRQRLDAGHTFVRPLHGDLPPAAQQAALAPSPPGRRKVVLASAVAETSLTIPGITAVVDSGLARRSVWSPRTGMGRLVTVTAGRANAEQRRGRAGRLAPGTCYRLWSEAEERGRPVLLPPEIADADLTPLALDLAAWGTRPQDLAWPTPPPAASLERAQALLVKLGAVDLASRITPHGREMARLPLHPRLAHMLLEARRLGFAGTAIAVAALLSGRDPWREDGTDMALRLERMRRHGLPEELARTLRQLRRLAGLGEAAVEPARCGAALALAFPERIGQRRGRAGAFRLASGRGAVVDAAEPLAGEDWLVAAELDDAGADARIRLAARLPAEEMERIAADRALERDEIAWDRRQKLVTARRLTLLGSLVLRERVVDAADPAALAAAMLTGVRDLGIGSLDWSREAEAMRARLGFLHRHEPEAWPATDDEALLEALRPWLEVRPARRPAEIDVEAFLAGLLDHAGRRRLDSEAPTHVVVPSGSRLPVDYAVDPPVLAVRLQEMLGSASTPAVRGGRTPLSLHLLSPAHRPVAVTRDLAGFWATGYPQVRKELRGRYPKHVWPEDPLAAQATARAKPRG